MTDGPSPICTAAEPETSGTDRLQLPRIPPEVWKKIAAQLSPTVHRESLCSLSLACSFLRDVAQSILFSTIRLQINPNSTSGHRFFTWIVPEEQDCDERENNVLERLEFFTSPRITSFVKNCTIVDTTLRISGIEGPPGSRFSRRMVLDQVVSSLCKFSALTNLVLKYLSMSGEHLRALDDQQAISRTLITFDECEMFGSLLTPNQIKNGFGSVRIISQLGYDSSLRPLMVPVLNPSLISLYLDIDCCDYPSIYTVPFANCGLLQSLTTLDIGERAFSSLFPLHHLFSNVTNLTVRMCLRDVGIDQDVQVSPSTFPAVSYLNCPINLFSHFSHCPVHELVIVSSEELMIWDESEDVLKDIDERHFIRQGAPLLSRISALKLEDFTTEKGVLEELVGLCPILCRFSVCFIMERGSEDDGQKHQRQSAQYVDTQAEIKTKATLRRLGEIDWPTQIESLECIHYGFSIWDDSSKFKIASGPIYTAFLNSLDLSRWPNLHRAVFGASMEEDVTIINEHVYVKHEDPAENVGEWRSLKMTTFCNA